jgi:integrase
MKGLRIVRGYVQIRLMSAGRYYHKNFGVDSPLARELAEIHLAEKRREILMGKFGIEKELPERTFAELVPVYKKMWAEEKDGDGRPAHSERAITVCFTIIDRALTPFFGKLKWHTIKSTDVERWRAARLDTGVLGTSVNREQVPLSSMFSHIERAVALERIPKFKLPADNPCKHVEKARTRKRVRIPTDYELKKLKLAFQNRQDVDGWEICKLALKSILSEKDLRKLELGAVIDTERSKTGVPVHIPITVLQRLNWLNWRKRWEGARKEAGLSDLQFRDLRKKGGNHLIGRHDTKLVSQYFGHASVKTTENSYVVLEQEKMRPLAADLETWVEGI